MAHCELLIHFLFIIHKDIFFTFNKKHQYGSFLLYKNSPLKQPDLNDRFFEFNILT